MGDIGVFYIAFLLANVCAQDFGYSREEQRRWATDFPQCGGSRQSPININTEQVIPIYMKPLKLFAYDRYVPAPLFLQNSKQTAEVFLNSTSRGIIPHISGGNLNGTYLFESFHFHWGKKGYTGSEHSIDGRFYSMELHIVHRNIKYTSNEAPNFPDGLAVLSILFQLSLRDNPAFRPIIDNLHAVRSYNAILPIWEQFTLKSLVETIDINRYYTYQGSLTTPPCTESVTWVIFSDVLKVSNEQLQDFRYLTDQDRGAITKNYRLLQQLNGRNVYTRKGLRWFQKAKTRLQTIINNVFKKVS